VTKELIAMAVDATPTHRFAPGFRLHLANALQLGASRGEVEHSLDIAAAAPAHSGVR
jgi:alkylhydroperoxidase/carboxymuconolactone decarboxylase family protein YurZ